MSDINEKAFQQMLQKLVDCNHIDLSVTDEAAKGHKRFI